MRATFLTISLLSMACAPAVGQEALSSQSSAGQPGVRCSQAKPVAPLNLLRDPSFKAARVVVEAEIVPPGEVATVTVVESSGYPQWDSAVVDAMKRLNCTLGAPVTATIRGRQTFDLSAK